MKKPAHVASLSGLFLADDDHAVTPGVLLGPVCGVKQALF